MSSNILSIREAFKKRKMKSVDFFHTEGGVRAGGRGGVEKSTLFIFFLRLPLDSNQMLKFCSSVETSNCLLPILC